MTMEKDKRIEQLMKGAGLVRAPENFTGSVMKKVAAEPDRKAYRPIIGRGGRLMILLCITALVVISVLYSEPGARFLENGFNLPEFNIDLGFLADIPLSTGILSALVALFILVLSDAGISRRRVL